MPAAPDKSPGEIYQLKITLVGTDPAIWRRVLVHSEITLRRLHQIIQTAMGWDDEHLHDFRVGTNIYGKPEKDHDPFGITRRQDEGKVMLRAVLRRVSSAALYNYDYGDDWQHRIVLEKRLKRDPLTAYPSCIGGELACPPEDCGGVFGYYGILEALEGPDSERSDELLEWLGGEYDPAAFSIDEVNRKLRGKKRASP